MSSKFFGSRFYLNRFGNNEEDAPIMAYSYSHFVGDRFGTYLRLTIPLLKSYYISEIENNEELRECILQAMESFLLVCSRGCIFLLRRNSTSYSEISQILSVQQNNPAKACPKLIGRFKEREEVAKTELMHEDPYTKALKSFGALLPRNDQRLHDHEKSEKALIIKVHFS
ncbi:hypothetical protein POM88_000049 [Heracleum sosnowskyi]|uniref:Uncharacterized protein n=1 Tax=Heracleum sosnowskyi TaxID=360622 RepID=A0AAD8N8C6_9APIA|nr:hypothetical protein POM88_000049 [Heracleum sosnowskyi]